MDVYQKFNEELNLVKKEFNTKTPNLTPTQPKFAGAAAWARALKRRIDRPMDVINKAFYLPRIGAGEEIRNQYQQLSQALEEFVGKTFQEWALSIDKVCQIVVSVTFIFWLLFLSVYNLETLCHTVNKVLQTSN